jgi:Fic family protein
LLSLFCQWLNEVRSGFPEGFERHYAIMVAIAAHIFFVWIHPFGDGNGRTARLIEFRYLLEAGFPTPAAHLLSNFYNQTRAEYYRQLDKASRSGGDISDFTYYAVQGLVDQLREQLKVIRNWQMNTTWRNYVYEEFGGNLSDAQARRRRLVLDLSEVEKNSGWIRTSQLRRLTPKLADRYAGKTQKALTRDLNAVEKMGLVERDRRKRWVRAKKRIILAFLPARIPEGPDN